MQTLPTLILFIAFSTGLSAAKVSTFSSVNFVTNTIPLNGPQMNPAGVVDGDDRDED